MPRAKSLGGRDSAAQWAQCQRGLPLLRADVGVDVDGGRLAVMGRCPDAEFIAVQLPPAAAQSTDIRVEVVRGASTVTVSWPPQGAGACAAWLREWLR